MFIPFAPAVRRMPPRERERSRRRRGPRGGNPDRPSQLSRRERGLPTEERGREIEREAYHRERGVEYRRVERERVRHRGSRDSRDWPTWTYISGLKIYDTGIPELKPPEGG